MRTQWHPIASLVTMVWSLCLCKELVSDACYVRLDALERAAFAMGASHIKLPMCTMGAESAQTAPLLDMVLPVLMVVAPPAHRGNSHFRFTRRQPVSAVGSVCSVLSVENAYHVQLEAYLSQGGSHALTVHRVALHPSTITITRKNVVHVLCSRFLLYALTGRPKL